MNEFWRRLVDCTPLDTPPVGTARTRPPPAPNGESLLVFRLVFIAHFWSGGVSLLLFYLFFFLAFLQLVRFDLVPAFWSRAWTVALALALAWRLTLAFGFCAFAFGFSLFRILLHQFSDCSIFVWHLIAPISQKNRKHQRGILSQPALRLRNGNCLFKNWNIFSHILNA